MSLNLGSLLSHSATRHRGGTALISGSLRFSYEELDAVARRFAAALLEDGVKRGDKVALMLPNGSPFTISYFAALYVGAVVVSLNTLQSAEEVNYQLTNSEAVALILHTDFSDSGLTAFRSTDSCQLLYVVGGEDAGATRVFDEALDHPVHADVCQTDADDTAVILYTSGTTGQPKGAELTHFNLFYNAQLVCERVFSLWPEEINVLGPGHVSITALPLYHIFGQTNVQNGMLFGGGTVSYLQRFTAREAVEIIARDRVTFFPAVPTMYFAILNECPNADLSSLRFCIAGGAPMPAQVKREFSERFGVRIQEGYGLTETSPLATVQSLDQTSKCGAIGKPIAGIDVEIHDDQGCRVATGESGEIVIRGHNVMKGYYKREADTADAMRGGWFHSGDIGHIDEDGDVVIVDRKKDMIIRGGYNVYPREVEEVLYTHPAIREAAVIGVPDERYGEEVTAVVSLKPGASASPREIIEFCKQHVAAYKYPRKVEIMDELPKTSTGKILKRALRD